ncbi:hypothetical protein HNR39_001340 [Glaciimonas immobilis]|uniref:Uncharacterized protein n=1 Tax=Glaciimonas immobilis TaxID=728004 RepID=A0A840RP28_9BURK|nr:hypothetical protein [Glaciimonas immobilis]
MMLPNGLYAREEQQITIIVIKNDTYEVSN